MPIVITGVKNIKPHDNENSLIVEFWNGAEIAVSSLCGIGISGNNNVYIHEQS